MAYDGLISSFLGEGVDSDRPATPNIAPGTIAVWYSTNTNELSIYADGAWVENIQSDHVSNALTINNSGSGDASGATFDGSAVKTISYNSIGAQPLDADLTALAALAATAGMLARTGAGTFAVRTLTGTANEVTVTNGDGSGTPTVSLPAALTFTGKTVTGGTFSGITDIAIADGGTGASTAAAARVNLLPALATNTLKGLRVNAAETDVEWATISATSVANALTMNNSGSGDASGATFDGSGAKTISYNTIGAQPLDADLTALAGNSTDGFWAHTGAGTGSARTITAPAAGFTITNPAGIAGNPTFVLANDLSAVEGISTNGMVARTASETWTTRTITASNGNITVTNGDGVSGNPTLLVNTYEGGPPTPPTTADLATTDNAGTSSYTDGTGAMIIKPQVDNVIHGRYKAGTPTDIYCRVEINTLSTNGVGTAYNASAGILLKDTGGDNERLAFELQFAQDVSGGDDVKLWSAVITRWSGASPPVFSATAVTKYGGPWQWLRVNNDSTTLTMYVSHDGRNWTSVGTETLAAYIDGAASYGVVARANSAATETVATFTYFSTTAPV